MVPVSREPPSGPPTGPMPQRAAEGPALPTARAGPRPVQTPGSSWGLLPETRGLSCTLTLCTPPTHRFLSTFFRSFFRLRWAPDLRFCRPFSKYRCSEKFSCRRGPGRGEVKGSWGLAWGLPGTRLASRLWVQRDNGCRWGGNPASAQLRVSASSFVPLGPQFTPQGNTRAARAQGQGGELLTEPGLPAPGIRGPWSTGAGAGADG